MCFGVRFSLYLASWLSDFDDFFLCVWFLAPLFFPQKMGSGQFYTELGSILNWILSVCAPKIHRRCVDGQHYFLDII